MYACPLPPPLIGNQLEQFKQLKSKVVNIAEGLSIPPELLARKKDLEDLIRTAPTSTSTSALPKSLQGWRSDIIGQPLVDMLTNDIK